MVANPNDYISAVTDDLNKLSQIEELAADIELEIYEKLTKVLFLKRR